MKTARTSSETWRLLVMLGVAMAMSAEAKVPVARQIVGQIESINSRTQQLVVTNNHRRVTVHWKTAQPCDVVCASPGWRVKLYYRREFGERVAREIAIIDGSNCCVPCRK